MDVDPAPLPPSSPPRFPPKLKGKLKADPDPLPNQDPPPPLPPQQPDQPGGDVTMIEDDGELKEGEGEGEGEGEEEEEDSVIREIDVFNTPLEGDAQLYVMQYPLKPHWRPYELEKRCEEVKLKPKSLEVEVVLSVDVKSENYDQDVLETTRFRKQTLSSSRAISVVDCTAGFLIKNQLYLNPVHQVLQFRPSKDHLNDPGAQKGKHKNEEVGTKSDKGKSVSGNLSDNIGSEEPWVSLQYNAIDSVWSRIYKEKLTAQKDYDIDFTMNRSEYLDSVCQRTSTIRRAAKEPSSFFPFMPLEERLKEWLRKECQVNRFDALKHLDTKVSEEDFLNMLQCHAVLVQGLWVSKSSLIYEGHDATLRDYILYLFIESHVIKPKQLKPLNIREDYLKKLLRPLAYERISKDWKFREERDVSFIKGHPQIVKRQEVAWSNRAMDLTDSVLKVGKARPMIAKNYPIPNITKRKLDAPNKISDATGSSAATSISNEMRDSLQKALSEIFSDGNACSLNSIQRKLQELALSKSFRPKEDSKTKALVNFISTTAFGHSREFLSVLEDVTFQVHNVYVLRSGQNPAHDPLREVIVKLFCGKEPNVKLKKQEIVEAAKNILQRDIPTNEYNQVVKELCVHSKGAWVLKNADNPV